MQAKRLILETAQSAASALLEIIALGCAVAGCVIWCLR